jgi:hypothetical protein
MIATIAYAIAWDIREVGELCFGRDDEPPCPPSPAEPTALLSTGRWVTWSAGLLLILAALVYAGRASTGRASAKSVRRLVGAAVGSGLLFSALVLAGP